MTITPTEVADIEKLVQGSRLTEVTIEQNGTSMVIGGSSTASKPLEPFTIIAPLPGTIIFEHLTTGQTIKAGDVVGQLSVLDDKTPITTPHAGRIAAILAADGTLVSYGTDLIQLHPETPI